MGVTVGPEPPMVVLPARGTIRQWAVELLSMLLAAERARVDAPLGTWALELP